MPHTMIGQHITHIRARIPVLNDIRDRKIHLAPAGGMTGDVRPPVNLAAVDTLNQLHALAITLASKSGVVPRSWAYAHAALWARLSNSDVTTQLQARDDAADIDRILNQADQRTRHWTQPRPNLKLIGMCPDCNQPQWADEHTTGDMRLTCPVCHTDYVAGELITSLYPALEWITGTATQLTRIINDTGLHVSTSLIRKYAHKGWINPVAYDPKGHAVYLMGDVLNVWRKNLTSRP